jgi:hypothetical protein
MSRLEIRPVVEPMEEYGISVGVDVLVDGEVLADTDKYAFSLHALRDSVTTEGEHYIVTCGCGIPECAGLSRGVRITRGDDSVEWVVLEPGPERRFRFDRDSYDAAVRVGIDAARATFAEVVAQTPSSKSVEAAPYGEEEIYRAG